MRQELDRAALLIIDLQRGFCCEDGSVASQGRDIRPCRLAADRSIALAKAARSRNMPTIWTRMVFREDYSDGGLLMRELRPGLSRIGALRHGTQDAELLPEIEIGKNDYVIDKLRYSSFYATSIEAILRSLPVDTLFVAGVTTSMCVESTVRDAAQRDYRTFVVEDACGDFDQDRHQASLAAMAFGFAVPVTLEQASDALNSGAIEYADR